MKWHSSFSTALKFSLLYVNWVVHRIFSDIGLDFHMLVDDNLRINSPFIFVIGDSHQTYFVGRMTKPNNNGIVGTKDFFALNQVKIWKNIIKYFKTGKLLIFFNGTNSFLILFQSLCRLLVVYSRSHIKVNYAKCFTKTMTCSVTICINWSLLFIRLLFHLELRYKLPITSRANHSLAITTCKITRKHWT